MTFKKEQHGNLTIQDIMLTIMANTKNYIQFKNESGLGAWACEYWESKIIKIPVRAE